MKRWPLVGGTLAVLWLFVTGVEPAPGPLAAGIVTGLLLGLPIAFVFRRFYVTDAAPLHVARSVPFALVYLGTFLWELLTANVDVAYRVLAPSMPIEPDVIEVPLRVESDAAITTIANSITLTPGTLTMDYDQDRNSLYVHAIAARDREAVIEPIRNWEDYALRIFDEERNPADPVPDPAAVENGLVSRGRSDPSASAGGDGDGE